MEATDPDLIREASTHLQIMKERLGSSLFFDTNKNSSFVSESAWNKTAKKMTCSFMGIYADKFDKRDVVGRKVMRKTITLIKHILLTEVKVMIISLEGFFSW